jgi:hypothetical protein
MEDIMWRGYARAERMGDGRFLGEAMGPPEYPPEFGKSVAWKLEFRTAIWTVI